MQEQNLIKSDFCQSWLTIEAGVSILKADSRKEISSPKVTFSIFSFPGFFTSGVSQNLAPSKQRVLFFQVSLRQKSRFFEEMFLMSFFTKEVWRWPAFEGHWFQSPTSSKQHTLSSSVLKCGNLSWLRMEIGAIYFHWLKRFRQAFFKTVGF